MGNYNAGRGFRQMKGMDKMIKTKGLSQIIFNLRQPPLVNCFLFVWLTDNYFLFTDNNKYFMQFFESLQYSSHFRTTSRSTSLNG